MYAEPKKNKYRFRFMSLYEPHCEKTGLPGFRLRLTQTRLGALVVNAADSGSRGRGFEPHSDQTVLCP